MTLFKISQGSVYDPVNGLHGEIVDLWIRDGVMMDPPTDPEVRPDRTLDASGRIVMPGGIDMHCHIAGSKVNTARKMRPADHRDAEPVRRTAITRSGTMGSVPSTFSTGYKYAGLGYTTAFDAAVPPLLARHTHEEFSDTPCIDKGFYLLMGNNHFVMDAIAGNRLDLLRSYMAWLLGASRAYACKLVNPGGVEVWKQQQAGDVSGLDSVVPGFDVTPRQIIREVARTANELGLPHPIHLHCNNLGMPGNGSTTLETMKALEGHRAHLTHIQFHSYAGGDADESTFGSMVTPLAEYINTHDHLTVDVGQILFGDTTSMTGDGPVGYYLSNVYQSRWYGGDVEMESGCGISPIQYRNKSLVHAWQWAIGLEWFLSVQDPWKIALSTDHPNGGSFLAYPQIIRLLMDRTYRADMLKTVHPDILSRSQLADHDREYSLAEIAIITRAGPARMLGLSHKGHLGPGADADITIYDPHENQEVMFSLPRYVIQAGNVLVEDGEIRKHHIGKTLHVAPEYATDDEPSIGKWFAENYSVQFSNYPVADEWIDRPECIPCGPRPRCNDPIRPGTSTQDTP